MLIESDQKCLYNKNSNRVGYPQLSAVIECADAAHGLGHMYCRWWMHMSGDVAKGFGGGADFVMRVCLLDMMKEMAKLLKSMEKNI